MSPEAKSKVRNARSASQSSLATLEAKPSIKLEILIILLMVTLEMKLEVSTDRIARNAKQTLLITFAMTQETQLIAKVRPEVTWFVVTTEK